MSETETVIVMNQVDCLRELLSLASEINDHFEEATHKARQAKELCNGAVKAAILCGAKLVAAKERCGHGKWLPWLAKHCPKVSVDTAQRWMSLAKTAHVRNLESCQGLRQAYIACGILPEPVGEEGEAKAVDLTPAAVSRWASSFTRRIAPEAVLAWPEQDRHELRDRLRPLVELFEKL